jgi:hypothetical protein
VLFLWVLLSLRVMFRFIVLIMFIRMFLFIFFSVCVYVAAYFSGQLVLFLSIFSLSMITMETNQ